MPRAGIHISSKIYPEDIKTQSSLAIMLPMNANASGKDGLFNVSYTTEQQAISNYINVLLTRKGERYMQPEFGVGLYWWLFEPNTKLIQVTLEDEIEMQADLWLPYIINQSITVSDPGESVDNTGTTIQITIVFKVTEYGANRTITIFGEGDVNDASFNPTINFNIS